MLGVDNDKVLTWIRSGELVAINVAQKAGRRPRWRIDPADFEKFKLSRKFRPVIIARRNRPRVVNGIIQFFPVD